MKNSNRGWKIFEHDIIVWIENFCLRFFTLSWTRESSYISVRPFLTFSYSLTLSAFDSQFLNSMDILHSCKHFMRLINLPSFYLKSVCEVAILIFKKNKQGIHACIVSNFYPGLEKMSIIWKILNFNSAYRVEIFPCNFNVILKRSLLFSRLLFRFNELKFQHALKICTGIFWTKKKTKYINLRW